MKPISVGYKIRKIRELKNLTQEHVAEQLGISQASYSKLESGEVEINASRIEKVAELFKMKPEEIYAFDENIVFNHCQNHGFGFNSTIHNTSSNERDLYEARIKELQEQIVFLKSLITASR